MSKIWNGLLAGLDATLLLSALMVVVAAGGHGSFGTTPGDTVLAYELK